MDKLGMGMDFSKIKKAPLIGAVTVDILFFIFRYKLYFLIE